MTVAVHNPSNLQMSSVKIAVPDGKFQVKRFDTQSETFMPANAVVLCHEEVSIDLD
jgi:hypothetical protein